MDSSDNQIPEKHGKLQEQPAPVSRKPSHHDEILQTSESPPPYTPVYPNSYQQQHYYVVTDVPPPPYYNSRNYNRFNQNQFGAPPNEDIENQEQELIVFVFNDKLIRAAFIKKVYSILTLQLLITCGIISLFIYQPDVKRFVQSSSPFLFAVLVVYVVTLIIIACIPTCRRQSPANYICLGIFTLATSAMCGTVSTFYEQHIVLIAFGSTALICLGLTLFAFQTKYDFTGAGGYLFVILFTFIIFGILAGGFRSEEFPILNFVYSGIGVLIFSCYLVYDTQLMLGGKHKYAISPEEYIFAALNLYLDVILIFMYILSIFGGGGGGRNNN